MTLAFHIAEIDVVKLVCGEEFAQIGACRQKGSLSAQESERLPQILHAIDIDLIDHRGFERVGFGDKQSALAPSARLQCNRQHAFYRPNRAVQRKLTDEAKVLKRRTVQVFRYGNHSDSNGQVETRSFFFDVGGSEVDCGTSAWPVVAAVCDRGSR